MLKVYIAGPDVFFKNFAEHFDVIREKCKEKGFEALIPLDNVCETSKEIYEANVKMIDGCDAVIANLNAFRGKEPDSGTCWEVGYATALKKTVLGYTSIKDWGVHIGVEEEDENYGYCEEGFIVEDFGCQQNLMLQYSCEAITESFDDALEELSKILPF